MTQPYSGKPSLDNSYARVRRAKNHLANLKRRNKLLWNPEGHSVIIVGPVPNVPPLFSILVGEVIYNLRSALDYLIYELAILDSGYIQKRTQFPIESTPKGFNGKRQSHLKGVSVKHQALIERLQPYNGTQWLADLANLSNPDKHRTLATIFPPDLLRAAASYLGIGFTDTFGSLTGGMHVVAKDAMQIAFDDGAPVIETLEILQSEVASVLNSFDSEF